MKNIPDPGKFFYNDILIELRIKALEENEPWG